MTGGLLLPALGLGALGWTVPRLLARVWPEGVRPLLVLALVAALILWALSSALFVLLYALGGAPMAALFGLGAAETVRHFLTLGLAAGLVWAPLLLLSVAGLPRRWKEETW